MLMMNSGIGFAESQQSKDECGIDSEHSGKVRPVQIIHVEKHLKQMHRGYANERTSHLLFQDARRNMCETTWSSFFRYTSVDEDVIAPGRDEPNEVGDHRYVQKLEHNKRVLIQSLRLNSSHENLIEVHDDGKDTKQKGEKQRHKQVSRQEYDTLDCMGEPFS
jgi:hypothetical protein